MGRDPIPAHGSTIGFSIGGLRSGIIGIEDREATLQAHGGMFDLQELQAQRMEGADGHLVGVLLAQALGHTLAHFLGRLVGEGDRGDAAGRVAATADQVGNLLHDHARLAAAGAGEHQQRAFDVQDRGSLGRIQTVHGDRIVAGCRQAHLTCMAPARKVLNRHRNTGAWSMSPTVIARPLAAALLGLP